MELPSMINYKSIKPKGFPTYFKRWEQFPQTSFGQSYSKNDVIRFLFQTDKFIDPYQSYIEIEVSIDPADYPYTKKGNQPVLALDGQSTSLISEMILYSNTKEIERIQEYDQLGCILHDLNMGVPHKQAKGYEGMKYIPGGNYANYNPNYIPASQTQVTTDLTRYNQTVQYGYNPYSIPGWNRISAWQQANGWYAPIATGGGGQQVGDALYQSSLENLDQFSIALDDYNQVNVYKSLPVNVANSVTQRALATEQYNYAANILKSDTNYGIQKPDNYLFSINNLQGEEGCNSKRAGYIRAFGPNCADDQVDILSPHIECLSMVNGFMTSNTSVKSGVQTNRERTITKKTYIVPILSGVLGVLIPSSEWRLIPGAGLGQMMFEFYLNRYAFFMSGVKDPVADTTTLQTFLATNCQAQTAQSSYSLQYNMNWTVSKFSLHFDLWAFDEVVTSQINQALNSEGIIISSTSWTLGPTYNINTSYSCKNNWQINNGIPSMKAFFFWFLLNDYTQYNFCRKQYRISNNITSVQLKVGQEYIPQVPITGHAGNIARNDIIKQDNTQFLVELHRQSNTFFTGSKGSKISAIEFAANERPYNVTYASDVANQVALFHETRFRGKAIYTIDTEANPYDQLVLSGLDTTKNRPIELVLDCDGQSVNSINQPARPSTMYTMFYHDFIVLFNKDGCSTVGRG